MSPQPNPYLPAVIESLVTGSPKQQKRWLAEAADSLDPDILLELEAQLCDIIDRRHPDDPASLLNTWHNEGERLKNKVRRTIGEALIQQTDDKVKFRQAVGRALLDDDFLTIVNDLYAQRRDADRQRRRDQIEDRMQASLAADDELQRQLALEDRAHQRRQQWAALEQDLAMDSQRVMAKLARAQRKLDQPHELLLRLYEVLSSLLQYQMSLNDRAMRNPALADRLQMMALGLTAVMSSVQKLIGDLNNLGGNAPEPQQLREQSDGILTLAMEQMQEWQRQTQQEMDL